MCRVSDYYGIPVDMNILPGLLQLTQIRLDMKYFTLRVFVVDSHVSNIYAAWMYVYTCVFTCPHAV
jgi:hypothetical protein